MGRIGYAFGPIAALAALFFVLFPFYVGLLKVLGGHLPGHHIRIHIDELRVGQRFDLLQSPQGEHPYPAVGAGKHFSHRPGFVEQVAQIGLDDALAHQPKTDQAGQQHSQQSDRHITGQYSGKDGLGALGGPAALIAHAIR